MASTLQKLMMPIFGYCNLSIPLLKHFIEGPLASRITYRIPGIFRSMYILRLSIKPEFSRLKFRG